MLANTDTWNLWKEFSEDEKRLFAITPRNRLLIWNTFNGVQITDRLIHDAPLSQATRFGSKFILATNGYDKILMPVLKFPPAPPGLKRKLGIPFSKEIIPGRVDNVLNQLRSQLTGSLEGIKITLDERAVGRGYAERKISLGVSGLTVFDMFHIVASQAELVCIFRKDEVLFLIPMDLRFDRLHDEVHLWDLETLRHLVTLRGHGSNVNKLNFLSKAGRLLVGTSARKFFVYDLESKQKVGQFRVDMDFLKISESKDGRQFFLTFPTKIEVRNSADGTLLDTFDKKMNYENSKISPDGTRVAVFSSNAHSLWNSRTGKCIYQKIDAPGSFPSNPFVDPRQLIQFSQDSSTVFFLEEIGGGFQVVDAESGVSRSAWESSPSYYEHEISSQDHRLVARTAEDKFCIWDIQSGNLLVTLPDPKKNNNKLLALWRSLSKTENAPESKPINPFSGPHIFSNGSASFSPSGEQVVAEWGSELAVWQRHRPEYWWGIAWLWEFWATVIFGIALVWSLCRKFSKRSETAAKITDQKPEL